MRSVLRYVRLWMGSNRAADRILHSPAYSRWQVDHGPLLAFHQSCQFARGGFSKFPEMPPDVLHSYYSVCALSIHGYWGVKPMRVELAISEDAWRHVASLKGKQDEQKS